MIFSWFEWFFLNSQTVPWLKYSTKKIIFQVFLHFRAGNPVIPAYNSLNNFINVIWNVLTWGHMFWIVWHSIGDHLLLGVYWVWCHQRYRPWYHLQKSENNELPDKKKTILLLIKTDIWEKRICSNELLKLELMRCELATLCHAFSASLPFAFY